MERIEELKQELLKQKKAIETKHGKVVVANLNPSPSEITAGIDTISAIEANLDDITATQADVLKGKKFIDSTGKMAEGNLKNVDWRSTTASVADVVEGKKFVDSNGDLQTGEMKDVDWENTTATQADVLSGKKFVDAAGELVDGALEKTDFSVVTAGEQDVLQGKQFYNSTGALVDGTMKDVDWENTTATQADVLSGKKFIDQNGDLILGTMKDVNWEATTATTADVLQGKQFVDSLGNLVEGSLKDLEIESVTATEQDVKQGKKFLTASGELAEGQLEEVDFSVVTAEENDVKLGKQFLDSTGQLKDGTFEAADCSEVTATEQDVKQGKKFLTASGELKEGTLKDNSDLYIYMPVKKTADPIAEIDYVFADDLTEVKMGLFNSTPYKMNIWLNPNTTHINDGAFSAYFRISLMNFNELSSLKFIGKSACSSVYGVDTMNIPESVTTIEARGLENCALNSSGIRFTAKMYTLGDYPFGCTTNYVPLDTIEFDAASRILITSVGMCYGFTCDREIVLPSTTKYISDNTFSLSEYNSIVLPEKLIDVGRTSFYNPERTNCKMVTFKGEKPPKFDSLVFHPNIQPVLKIYVPDVSVQEYKNALPDYKIYPMSERP